MKGRENVQNGKVSVQTSEQEFKVAEAMLTIAIETRILGIHLTRDIDITRITTIHPAYYDTTKFTESTESVVDAVN